MNHKQMLEKFSELERRVRVLELERELLQLKLASKPVQPQIKWHETTKLDPRYQSESLL